MDSAQLARRFEREFKNNANHGIAGELMSEDSRTTCPAGGRRRGAPGSKDKQGGYSCPSTRPPATR
jgi:hypothetical protein